MNPKIAKRLRKEARYHPSKPREYTTVNKCLKHPFKAGTQELVDYDPRVLYKELKKEYYNNK